MVEFSNQIERAAELGKNCIILGDANLNALKWHDENFLHKNISTPVFFQFYSRCTVEGQLHVKYVCMVPLGLLLVKCYDNKMVKLPGYSSS